MKRIKSVIAVVMAAVLCLTSVCPAVGAETADDGKAAAEETARMEEDIVREETGVPEVGPIVEKAESEKRNEPPDSGAVPQRDHRERQGKQGVL